MGVDIIKRSCEDHQKEPYWARKPKIWQPCKYDVAYSSWKCVLVGLCILFFSLSVSSLYWYKIAKEVDYPYFLAEHYCDIDQKIKDAYPM